MEIVLDSGADGSVFPMSYAKLINQYQMKTVQITWVLKDVQFVFMMYDLQRLR